jgi:chemotaxis protein methyltransferase CheR
LNEIEQIEVELLLEAVYRKYGYDFRDYTPAHARRRIRHRLAASGIDTVSELQGRVLREPDLFQQLLLDFSINVTEMFRDPPFYRTVREEVVPILRTYPFVRIWHAGCSSGEEVYSMAILLREEGLYDRTQIYATDFNEKIVRKAKEGIYDVERIKDYTANYQKAGGKASFADYYMASYGNALMDTSLKQNIVFSQHNLVTDGVFGEMQMIVCRNVLIYFERELQDRVIGLWLESLCPGGLLCLGSREGLMRSVHAGAFEAVSETDRIYRKRFNHSERLKSVERGG